MTDPGSFAASSVAVGQTVSAYQFFLPSLREVRQADPHDPGMRSDVMMGQLASATLALSVGFLFTLLSGSRTPLWVAVVSAFVMAGIYHYALNQQGDSA